MSPRFDLSVVVPAGSAGTRIAASVAHAGGMPVLDLMTIGRAESVPGAIQDFRATPVERRGVLVDPDRLDHVPTDAGLAVAILASRIDGWESTDLAAIVVRARARAAKVFVEIVSREEGTFAVAAGADGLIVKGHEAGGRSGDETTFVLLQQTRDLGLPRWARGGIGLHSMPACWIAGACGVVLDDQLLLADESELEAGLETRLRAADGSEAIRVTDRDGRGIRVVRSSIDAIGGDPSRFDDPRGALAAIESGDARAWGQDIALAPRLAERFGSVREILRAYRGALSDHLRLAVKHGPLAEGSPLAVAHATRWPIVQGPMTRVSDVAPFADAVSRDGALPLLALALMRRDEARSLLETTASLLGTRSWGVGILGFVPPDLRDEQLEAIRDVRPRFAIVAGGRPDQATQLEEEGIAAYLHVPSVRLLRMFLDQGVRRFVFEGRECGGHVGPLSSAVLWDRVVDTLVEWLNGHPGEQVDALFAGGIHDRTSAAMAAAVAVPLVEAGGRFGVLMGTAYLFTKEAVESGAIVAGFQEAMLACRRTVLLDAEGGHATRCADTPYGDEFRAEKRRLEQSGIDREELRSLLETLNVGRLRIATKGRKRVHRDDGSSVIVDVEADVRKSEGLYMAGQVAALRDSTLRIAELHREVCAGSVALIDDVARAYGFDHERAPGRSTRSTSRAGGSDAREPIAIIGMSGFFPGATSLDRFRMNLFRNVDAIREVPPSRWDADLFYDPDQRSPDRVISKWGGFLEPVVIDPTRFGIPPSSVGSIEPTQLLVLEAVRRLFEDSGYDRRPFARDRTAVIIGHGGGASDLGAAYQTRCLVEHYLSRAEGLDPAVRDAAIAAIRGVTPSLTEDSFPGILGNVAAGRVANRFDLGGPNYTIDAACASSLAAVEAAIRELRFGTSDVALVGGFDGQQHPFGFLLFSKTQALSARGRCRPFDRAADGIAISEAVAFVMLKRLADAERDGDRIVAVILGTGSASDGRDKSLTAPNPHGQRLAMARAYEDAGVPPESVSLVEAHGTGTVVGDRTELATLLDVFEDAPGQSCALGSVKSQIGHTKNAAGLCGLIKVALGLHHRAIPPTLVDSPGDVVRDRSIPFYLSTRTRPWFHSDQSPRRAGVSAFGFGGTNFHVVLEEHPTFASAMPERDAELFVLSAATPAALASEVAALRAKLEESEEVRAGDLARSLARHSESGQVRLSIVAGDVDELRRLLALALDAIRGHGPLPEGAHYMERSPSSPPRVAYLFPGQGSQYVGMLDELAVAFPVLRETVEDVDRALDERLGDRLSTLISPPPPYSDEEKREARDRLAATRVAQPALGAVEIALVRLLDRLGLRPAMAAGHSYGEYVALAVGGAFSFPDLLRLSEARGRIVQESQGRGEIAMLAVSDRHERVEELLVEGVSVAGRNAPRQTIVGGRRDAIDRFASRMRELSIGCRKLSLSAGFHIPEAKESADRFVRPLDETAVGPIALPVYSNVTGERYPDDANRVRETLLRQLVEPVDFQKQIESMRRDGADLFLEVGPGRVLTRLAGEVLGNASMTIALNEGQPGRETRDLLGAIGRLWTLGAELRLMALFDGAEASRVPMERLFGREAPTSKTAVFVDGGGVRPFSATAETDRSSRRALREVEAGARARPVGTVRERGGSFDRLGAASGGAIPTDSLDAMVLRFLDHQRESQRRRFELMNRFLEAARGRPAEWPSTLPEPRPVVEAKPDGIRDVADTREEVEIPIEADPPGDRPRDLKDLVLRLVSERTGYPVEMLDLDHTMEGDLGIDSIKRTEIFGALRDSIEIGEMVVDQEEYFLAISRLRTLREVLAWLGEHMTELPQSEEAPPKIVVGAGAIDADGFSREVRIVRCTVEVRGADAPSGQPPLVGVDGATLLTADGAGHADELARAIRGLGRSCVVVRHGDGTRRVGSSEYEADLSSHTAVDQLEGDALERRRRHRRDRTHASARSARRRRGGAVSSRSARSFTWPPRSVHGSSSRPARSSRSPAWANAGRTMAWRSTSTRGPRRSRVSCGRSAANGPTCFFAC